MSGAYYNENDPFAVHVLRGLISSNVIAPGDVDERSIKDVQPDDILPYTQAHFFAGGGLWSVAARMAGWPDTRPLWSASPPCQPFSQAGSRKGENDLRHLWPDFHRLITTAKPTVCFGEQVARTAGRSWFDGVSADLEKDSYAVEAFDIPACSVDAPHKRNRLYWVASLLAYRDGGDSSAKQLQRSREHRQFAKNSPTSFWSDSLLQKCNDGKARRIKPGICVLDDGISKRMGLLRIGGNAIVPQVAAEVISAFLDCETA